MNWDTRGSRVVLAVLLVLSLALLTVDRRGGDSSPITGVRGAAGAVFGPLESAAAALVRPVRGFAAAVGDLGSTHERISALEQENQRLTRELRTAAVDRRRVAALDALLRVAGAGQYRVVPAQTVALGPAQSFGRTATIDAGSRDGVRPGMTVLDGNGVVGRVTAASPLTSTVLLATDPASAIGVRLESTAEIGWVDGNGSSGLVLELPDPQASVKPGDRLVTFGSQGGRPFVAGVPVGEVVRVLSAPGSLAKRATVRPYVDFATLDVLGVVVQPPRRDPRDSVLPRRPGPRAAT